MRSIIDKAIHEASRKTKEEVREEEDLKEEEKRLIIVGRLARENEVRELKYWATWWREHGPEPKSPKIVQYPEGHPMAGFYYNPDSSFKPDSRIREKTAREARAWREKQDLWTKNICGN